MPKHATEDFVNAFLGDNLFTVADIAARKNTATYAGIGGAKVAATRVIQADMPGVLWNLVASDVTLDASWIGVPYTVDPDGDIIVSMELADVAGTVPDANVLGQVQGIPTIGDAVTDGGKRVAMRSDLGLQYFQHTLSPDQWAKALKFVSTKSTAFSAAVKTTTGYARILNFDGTFEAVDGAGVPANNITCLAKTPVSPYDTLIPKFYAIYPCDVAGNVSGDITYLLCGAQQITSLDVSANTALTYIYCPDNQLTTLDVSANTALTELYCADNHLTSLDVSANNALTTLDCADNQLTTLDVSANTALILLYCGNNQLVVLRAIGVILSQGHHVHGGSSISENLLDAAALNQFYTDLGVDVGATGIIDVTGNPGTSGDDPTIATAKGYTITGT